MYSKKVGHLFLLLRVKNEIRLIDKSHDIKPLENYQNFSKPKKMRGCVN